MKMWSQVRSWLHAVMRRSRMENEMDTELRFHIEAFAEDLVSSGVPRGEALRRARVEFGGVERAKEECREARGVNFLDGFIQDLSFGLRMFHKNPGFTTMAVVTLALGIGANTLIFSVAYGVLLCPLPYPSPERMVTLWESNLQKGSPQGQVSAANFYDWQRDNRVLSSAAAYAAWRFNLTGVAQAESLSGALVTADFFSVLEVAAGQGRTFQGDEDQPGKSDVVVVSESLWNRVFGSSTKLSGQTLTLNRKVMNVVGVMPPDFRYPSPTTEIWVPLDLSVENRQNRDGRWLTVVARMKPGVTEQQVIADMNMIASRLRTSHAKEDADVNIRVVGLHEYVVGETRTVFIVLLGAVALLLTLACANVASLLFARGSGRTSEFAVRYAIGAARGRLIRQLLTESALLVAAGAFLGTLLAYWGVRAFRLLEKIPRIQNITIDPHVIAFTLGVSVLVAGIVGLLPAFRASRYEFLRESSQRPASGPAVQRQRAVLVIAQVSLAFVLLIGAGLLTNSFLRLSRVSPGFQVDERLSFQTSLPTSKYRTNGQQVAFFDHLIDRINQQAGVLGSGGVSDLPLLGNRMGFKVLREGAGSSGDRTPPVAGVRWVTPGYFGAIGMSLSKGRLFSSQDGADALPVAIINQSMADRVWPGRDPIGLRVRLEEDLRWYTIVGVVGDIKQEGLASDEGSALYFPYAQKSEVWLSWMFVVVHTAQEPHSLAAAVREQVRSLDKDQPIRDVSTLEEHLADLQALPRLRMIVMQGFSSIAFCLTLVGIFGLISHSVAQRFHEIGVRMALGAQPWDIFRQFLGQGMRCVLWGLTLGFCGALVATRVLKSLLFVVDPLDGLTFALVTAVLIVVALAACVIPSWRGTRVDPIEALRYE